MSYSERCVLRLHDVVVTRKALNLALSYYPVVRECVLGVVEKARKPRKEEEKEGEKATSAASQALEAMEQLVNGLASGQAEVEVPVSQAPKKKEVKRTVELEPGFEEEKKPRGKGKGRGRGRDKEISETSYITIYNRQYRLLYNYI